MIIAIILIWVICFAIWYNKQNKKKEQEKVKNNPQNYYIAFHQAKLKNDQYYNEYLQWCNRNAEIPMSKQKFIKEVENNEDKIKNLFK